MEEKVLANTAAHAAKSEALRTHEDLVTAALSAKASECEALVREASQARMEAAAEVPHRARHLVAVADRLVEGADDPTQTKNAYADHTMRSSIITRSLCKHIFCRRAAQTK